MPSCQMDLASMKSCHSQSGRTQLDTSTTQSWPDGAAQHDTSHGDPCLIKRSRIRHITMLMGLYATLFVSALNTTLVATILPSITQSLQSSEGYAWIGGAYILASASFSPAWISFSNIWGRKMILLLCVGGFTVFSGVCASATSMHALILGRALQGFVGGGMVQTMSVVICDLFSVRERQLYFSLQQVVWAIAGGLGPFLGGVFAQHFTWRAAFYFNTAFSGVAFVLLFVFLDVHNPHTRLVDGLKAVDWSGIVCVIGFVLMFLLALSFGGDEFSWQSASVIGLIIGGVLLLPFFVFVEKCLAKHPVVPLELFASRHTVAALSLACFQNAIVVVVEYYLPVYFQTVKQMSPSKSGLLIMPLVVAEAVFGIVARAFMTRTGRYVEVIWAGITALVIGTALYTIFDKETSLAILVIVQIVAALGAGLLFEPPLTAIHAAVTQEATATATGTVGFLRSVVTAVAVVVGGVLFQNGLKLESRHLRDAGLPCNVITLLTDETAIFNSGILLDTSSPSQCFMILSAFAHSLRTIWIFCACLGGVCFVAGLMIQKLHLSEEHVETRTGLKDSTLTTSRK